MISGGVWLSELIGDKHIYSRDKVSKAGEILRTRTFNAKPFNGTVSIRAECGYRGDAEQLSFDQKEKACSACAKLALEMAVS